MKQSTYSTGTSYGAGAATSLQKRTDFGAEGSSSKSSRTQPDHEQIAKLAYQFWEERGRPSGAGEEDWLRAENYLRSRG